MKWNAYDILKGKFLVSDAGVKNWRFIFFCMMLAIVMIACSHSAESKVHEIAKRSQEVQELRSASIDAKERLMRMKMESTVSRKLNKSGVAPSDEPPQKIKITGKNN